MENFVPLTSHDQVSIYINEPLSGFRTVSGVAGYPGEKAEGT